MNKLSTHIFDFSRHRRAFPVAKIAALPRLSARLHQNPLLCRWHNDPDTGQLTCAWIVQDTENMPRLRLAS